MLTHLLSIISFDPALYLYLVINQFISPSHYAVASLSVVHSKFFPRNLVCRRAQLFVFLPNLTILMLYIYYHTPSHVSDSFSLSSLCLDSCALSLRSSLDKLPGILPSNIRTCLDIEQPSASRLRKLVPFKFFDQRHRQKLPIGVSQQSRRAWALEIATHISGNQDGAKHGITFGSKNHYA